MPSSSLQITWVLLVTILTLSGLFVIHDREQSSLQLREEQYARANRAQQAREEFQVSPSEHIRGNLNEARVIVIEYSDTECPYCKTFHGKFQEQIFQIHPNKVAWVYRHYPLSIYPRSRKEAEALECATEQGGNNMFWAYLEALFEITPSENRLEPEELPKLAKKLALDVPAFQNCLTQGRYEGEVSAQHLKGSKSGVNQAPSVILMDKQTGEPLLISGANGRFLEIKALIEEILSPQK